jgi:hypothetical protein
MFLNVVPIVCIIIKLPNFGKFNQFVSVVKALDEIFVMVVGGLGCGWVKLNVVFLFRQVRWQNTSFNFAKRWHLSYLFLSVFCRSCRFLG